MEYIDNNSDSNIKPPKYELFRKKNSINTNKRCSSSFNYRNAKCPKDKLQVTEKWFEERLTQISPTNNDKPLSLNELEDQILQSNAQSIVVCDKCCKQYSNTIKTERCNHSFCSNCIDEYKILYNRCPKCSCIINLDNAKHYEDDDIIIPSYDNFHYYNLIYDDLDCIVFNRLNLFY
jgi:hypothetical protein